MKNKIIAIILTAAVIVAFILGATGVISLTKEKTPNSNDTINDRLVGVFITKESLNTFDFESYFNDNANKIISGGEISQADSVPYQNKIYAKLVDDSYTDPDTGETIPGEKYVFEGVEGIGFFAAKYSGTGDSSYWGTSSDEGISDSHVAFNTTDAGESIELKGTIYFSASASDNLLFFNPVYQTPTGEVYTVEGECRSYGGEISNGVTGSMELKDEQKITVDGKSETVSTIINISTCFMDTPTGTIIFEFDKNGRIVSSKEYEPNHLPGEIRTKANTEYIIVETHMKSPKGEKTVSRELFQPDDESLFGFSCKEGGICLKESCDIAWKNSGQ